MWIYRLHGRSLASVWVLERYLLGCQVWNIHALASLVEVLPLVVVYGHALHTVGKIVSMWASRVAATVVDVITLTSIRAPLGM